MQHYNIDGTLPNNRVNEEHYRYNNAQSGPGTGDAGFLQQERMMLSNITASTSDRVPRYEDQNYRRPSCRSNSLTPGSNMLDYNSTLSPAQYAYGKNLSGIDELNNARYSMGWNEHSGSSKDGYQLLDNSSYDVTRNSSTLQQSLSSPGYLNTRVDSFPTNQADLWYGGDATSKSSPLDIRNRSSDCNEMHGYATGNYTLTDQMTNIPRSGTVMPRLNQSSKQLSQVSTQEYSQLHSYLNQPNQSMSSQPLLSQKHKMLRRETHHSEFRPTQQPVLSQTQQLNQGFTQPLNQNTRQETKKNKYQQMHQRQTEQWRQQHTGNDQQMQQNLTAPEQNWTQPLQSYQIQQMQQNPTGQQQNWTTPVQQCQTQHADQRLNQELETHLTPILKDLRFSSTPTLRFSDNLNLQNHLDTCVTPILKNNGFNQNWPRRMNKRDSSNRQSAQKELFQQNQGTWSDHGYALQNASIDCGTNSFDRNNLWTGEQKENLPVRHADKHFTANSDFTNDVLAIEQSSSNNSTVQESETFENSEECNLDARISAAAARISAAASFLSFMQEPGKTMNSGLTILDMLSDEDKELYLLSIVNHSDQINVDIPAVTASCSNGPPLQKTPGKTFTCEICDKVYQSRSSLRAHRLRHLDPTKRYGCTTCDSKFSDRSSLRKHLRVHTGEQPFECTICGSRFSQAGNLRRHERMSHSTTDQQNNV